MKEEQLKNVSNLISASLDQDKEIIKLNNTIIDLHSVICEKQNEINRLNNIIKEIKEICKNYEKYKEQWFEEECKDALDDISGLMYEELKEGK